MIVCVGVVLYCEIVVGIMISIIIIITIIVIIIVLTIISIPWHYVKLSLLRVSHRWSRGVLRGGPVRGY